MVQRTGRTGRSRNGRVVCLVSKGQEEDRLHRSEVATKTLWNALKNPTCKAFKLTKNTPLLPEQPVLKRENMNVVKEYRLSQIGGHSQRQKKTSTSISRLDDSNSWILNDVEEMSRFQEFGQCTLNSKVYKEAIKAWQNVLPTTKTALKERPIRALGQGPLSAVLREIETSTIVAVDMNIDISITNESTLDRASRNLLPSFSVNKDDAFVATRGEPPRVNAASGSYDDESDEAPMTVFSPDDNYADSHVEIDQFEVHAVPHCSEANFSDFENIFGPVTASSAVNLPNDANAIIFGAESANEMVEPPGEYSFKSHIFDNGGEFSVGSFVDANRDITIELDSPRATDNDILQDVPILEEATERSHSPNFMHANDLECKEMSTNGENEGDTLASNSPKATCSEKDSELTNEIKVRQASSVNDAGRDVSIQDIASHNVEETSVSIIELLDDESESAHSVCFDLPTQDSSSSSSSSSAAEDSDVETSEPQSKDTFSSNTNEEMHKEPESRNVDPGDHKDESNAALLSSSSSKPQKEPDTEQAPDSVTPNRLNLQQKVKMVENSLSTVFISNASGSSQSNLLAALPTTANPVPHEDKGRQNIDLENNTNGTITVALSTSNSTAGKESDMLQTPATEAPSRLKLRQKVRCIETIHKLGDDDEDKDDTPIFHRSRAAKTRSDLFLSQFPTSPSAHFSQSSHTPHKKRALEENTSELFDTPSSEQLKDTPLKDTPLKDTPLKDTPLKDTPTSEFSPSEKQKRVEILAKRRKKNKDVSKFFDIEAEASGSEDDEDGEDAGLSQDSFINDSSQLDFTQDILDTLECDKSQVSNSSGTLALHRRMMKEQNETFATPILARNRNRSTQLSLPSSEKNLGKMHFIRSVIEHHRQGGNANEIESEYHAIMKEAATSKSQESSVGSQPTSSPQMTDARSIREESQPPSHPAQRPPIMASATKKTSLTAEQLVRIENNRKRALILRQKKLKK